MLKAYDRVRSNRDRLLVGTCLPVEHASKNFVRIRWDYSTGPSWEREDALSVVDAGLDFEDRRAAYFDRYPSTWNVAS